jgi:hypothetical protein
MRPISPTLPFKIGDSVRLLDPTMPEGATAPGFDPVTGNPITVTNTKVNFGWEYVWHCHLLGHEENDMMRAIIFNVAPAVPTAFTAVPSGGPTQVTLAWANNWTLPKATNSLVQRATNAAFTSNVTTVSVAAGDVGYVDTAVDPNTQYYYRVRAENANSYSVWTKTVAAKTPAVALTPNAPTGLTISTATRTSLKATWTNPAGPAVTNNIVQYSRNGSGGPWTTAATLAAGSTTYTITGLRNDTTYWIRVNAVNAAGTASSAVKTGRTLR